MYAFIPSDEKAKARGVPSCVETDIDLAAYEALLMSHCPVAIRQPPTG